MNAVELRHEKLELCRHVIRDLRGARAGEAVACAHCRVIARVHRGADGRGIVTIHEVGPNNRVERGRIPWEIPVDKSERDYRAVDTEYRDAMKSARDWARRR